MARIVVIVALCGCFAGLGAVAQAQTAPSPASSPPANPCESILALVNRPTLATSACAVPTNHFLIESGYTNTVTTGEGGGNTGVYPQAVVRIGTADPRLEFDFVPPTYARSSTGGAIATGWVDIAVGAQYNIGYSDNAVWGANALVSIPTGSPAVTAGNAQYTGNFNWGYTLGSVFSLFGTMSFNALSGANAGGAPQSYFTFIPSVGITESLPANSQVFAEYSYFTQAGPGLGGKTLFDFGYQHDIGPHLVLDVNYGFSPTVIDGQEQHYVGAGLSFMN